MNRSFGPKRMALISLILAAALVCAGFIHLRGPADVSSDEISISSCEGTVTLEDGSGNRKSVAAGTAIASSHAIITGEDSSAIVSLGQDRTLYMDENTRVVFVQDENSLELTVSEGKVLLDVLRKLEDDETLTISTAAMDVDIRGTIVGVEDQAKEAETRTSALNVFEGLAQASFTGMGDQPVSVPAGQRTAASYLEKENSVWVNGVTQEQIFDEKLDEFYAGVLSTPSLLERVPDAASDTSNASSDDGNKQKVIFIAQSASKTYDGEPLTRPDDVMVFGLPQGYTAKASARGSRTDVGNSLNTVSEYHIFNDRGEDVTSQFAISLESGLLVVDRATITVWTGSAEKTYDGKPLTNPEAKLLMGMLEDRSSPNEPAVQDRNNSACRIENADGQKELYGISGITWVHGTNPLTGDMHNVYLRAGQKLIITFSDNAGLDRVEFVVKDVKEDDLPEEILRLFAADPELLKQSCADTGWDRQVIERLIRDLQAKTDTQAGKEPEILQDSVNVRLIVGANTGEDAKRTLIEGIDYYSVTLNESIKVTATGSQTEVGKSKNTFRIDWGTAKPDNYIVIEKLGTLTVLEKAEQSPINTKPQNNEQQNNEQQNNKPDNEDEVITAAVTFKAGSASKVYDGTPLTAETFTVEGLPDGYTYTASCVGSRTDAGSGVNTVVNIKIYDAHGKEVTSLFKNLSTKTGTLTVEPLELEAAWTSEDGSELCLPYDGSPYTATIGVCSLTYLNGDEDYIGKSVVPDDEETDDEDKVLFTLYTGDKIAVTASGQGQDAGTYDVSVQAEVASGKSGNYKITTVDGSFTINKAKLYVETGSAEKAYDGTPLTEPSITVYRIPDDEGENYQISQDGVVSMGSDEIQFTADGSNLDSLEEDNTYSIEWNGANSGNYDIASELGKLRITFSITIVVTDSEKPYDGTPLTSDAYTVQNLPAGWQITNVTFSGSQTEVGESDNVVTGFKLVNAADQDVTEELMSSVTIINGKLKVTQPPGNVETVETIKIYRSEKLIEFTATHQTFEIINTDVENVISLCRVLYGMYSSCEPAEIEEYTIDALKNNSWII